MKKARQLKRKAAAKTLTRKTSCQRGYDRHWQRVRDQKLNDEPCCFDCLSNGGVTEAKEVHHKVKISKRPDLRLEPSNLMSLCKSCHSIRTAKGE